LAVLPGHPQTLLRWHREAAEHKWRRWRRRRGPGRPPMAAPCRSHRSSRPGEPSVGMRAHPGRVAKARDPRVGQFNSKGVLSENSIFVSRGAFVLVDQPTETVVSTDQT
jgi:hypothetical protein